MNTTEANLEVGKEYLYKEDGGIQRIKVLEAGISEGFLNVKFEILDVLSGGLCHWNKEELVGEVMDVCKVVDAHVPFAMWEIEPLE